jgi:very-short-patch-repair endonuclease
MPHQPVNPRQRGRAKNLRRAMTRAETLLWRYLKAHHVDGLGFRRQVPMQSYIADFICHAARLVIELDGESHDFESSQRRDRTRDAWFESQGYVALRYTNDEVLTNLAGVVENIRETVAARASGLPPSLALPHQGGGNTSVTASSPSTTAGNVKA